MNGFREAVSHQGFHSTSKKQSHAAVSWSTGAVVVSATKLQLRGGDVRAITWGIRAVVFSLPQNYQ